MSCRGGGGDLVGGGVELVVRERIDGGVVGGTWRVGENSFGSEV